MPTGPDDPSAGRDRRLLSALVLGALALRVAFVLSTRSDLLFEHPILDEQRYVDAARQVAAGGGFEARPFWQPPGEIAVLALIFRVAGPGLLAPRLVQAVVGAAAVGLAYAVGRHAFDRRVGLVAAALLAAHGVLVFEGAQLLPSTWMLTLDLLALALLQRVDGSALRAAVAGLALGVSAVFSPVVLPLVLPVAVGLRRARLVLPLLLGVALPIAPVAAHNRAFDDPALVSTNGGLNLFLGNNPRYLETFALRPGRAWDELVFAPDRAGVLPGSPQSAWFVDRVAGWAQANPGDAAALVGRKLLRFVHGAEIPRDTDLYAAREGSGLLRVLVGPRSAPWPDALLIPLAGLGVALAWPSRRRWAPVLGFVLLQALLVSAFFVTSRHRVPALGGVAVLAGAGVVGLVDRLRTPRALVAPLLALAAAVVLASLPTEEAALSWPAEADLYRGLAWARQGNWPQATEALERSIARDPTDVRAFTELAKVHQRAGRLDAAAEAWRRAAALDPADPLPLRRVAGHLASKGDLDGAAAAIAQNLAAPGRPPEAYLPEAMALALVSAQRHRPDDVVTALRRASVADHGAFVAQAPRWAAEVAPAALDAAGWARVRDVLVGEGVTEPSLVAWLDARSRR